MEISENINPSIEEFERQNQISWLIDNLSIWAIYLILQSVFDIGGVNQRLKKLGGGQGFGILLQDLPKKFIIAQSLESLHEVLLKILFVFKRS